MNIPCKSARKERARRYCPGVQRRDLPRRAAARSAKTPSIARRTASICRPPACHEEPAPITAEDLPNKDIRLTEDFVREHEYLVMWLALALTRVMEQERAVDSDAREAMDALIRTYRTRESGLIYETRPQNPYAAGDPGGAASIRSRSCTSESGRKPGCTPCAIRM